MHDPPRIPRRTLLTGCLGLGLGTAWPITALAQGVHPPVGSTPPRGVRGATPPRPPAELVQLAGRCVIAGFHGTVLPPILRARLARNALGGVLVAGDNIPSWAALDALSRAVQDSLPAGAPPVLVAADQEGGAVSHLTPPLPAMPSMTTLGVLDDLDLTRRVGAALGTTMRLAGCNMDLAPVLDVRTCTDNLVDLGRVFGRHPDLVARHGVALSLGLRTAGVLACAKHFPGHGDTREDSHVALPRLAHGRARLEAIELVPFRAAMDVVPAVMLAHVVYAGMDPALPASLSPAIARGLLRDGVGYTGVAVSDDLEMAPIRQRYGVAGAAVMAVEAGCDLVMVAHTPTEALAAVDAMALAAAARPGFHSRLTQAAGRVDAMRATLAVRLPPNPFSENPADLLNEVATRSRGHGRGTPAVIDPTRQR